ncbi:hypothetical protein MLD38_005487 [Melastoma candidum]|uniref:Uncharacterized protein n=1 Tax=Melastoma candidum TaxID=119954 RepID=A0ACB9RJC7_9MYRT|nr:hypothetical protein MLD38_005487 [Melastoma candidum]
MCASANMILRPVDSLFSSVKLLDFQYLHPTIHLLPQLYGHVRRPQLPADGHPVVRSVDEEERAGGKACT